MGNFDHSAAMENRIKDLRMKAGLTHDELALLVPCSRGQLIKLERGERSLSPKWMQRIGRALKVRPEALLSDSFDQSDPGVLSGTLATIDELDVGAGAADGGRVPFEVEADGEDNLIDVLPVRQSWVLPSDIAGRVTRSGSDSLKILTVQGTSMVPDFLPGDRIMVDTTDTTPSPPGNFIVWDGLNLVVKFVQHLAHSEPPTIRLTSRHPDIEPYERSLGEAFIQGRVIGKWQWT